MEHFLLEPDVLRLVKLTPAAAQSEFYEVAEEGGEPVLRADAAAIFARKVLERLDAERKDKLGQGIRQRSQQVEQVVRPLFDAFEVKSDDVIAGLTDLAEKIELLKKEKPNLANLTDEEVVKLPAFQKKLNAELQAAREAREQVQREFEQFKTQVERQHEDTIIFGHMEKALVEANAAFGANRTAQLQHFFRGLNRDYIHLSENGIELLDSDGIALRGPNKELLTWQEYVVQKWKDLGYGIHDAAPQPPTPGKPGKPGNFTTSAQVKEALKTVKNQQEKAKLLTLLAELMRQGK